MRFHEISPVTQIGGIFHTQFRAFLRRTRDCLRFSLYHKTYKHLPIIPFYHTVSDSYLPHVRHLFRYRGVSEFESDLRLFSRHFKFLSLSQFLESRESASRPKAGLLLTFDDGLRECYDIIHPILNRYDIPAVFFLTTDFLDNKELFYRHKASLLVEHINSTTSAKLLAAIAEKLNIEHTTHTNEITLKVLQLSFDQQELIDEIALMCEIDFAEFLHNNRPYLDTAQVIELASHGYDIGAHGLDHQWLNEITLDSQLAQIRGSTEFLTSLIEEPSRSFAFPFNGDGLSPEIFEKVLEDNMVDIMFGAGGVGTWDEPYYHRRFSMEGATKSARQILTKQYQSFAFRQK